MPHRRRFVVLAAVAVMLVGGGTACGGSAGGGSSGSVSSHRGARVSVPSVRMLDVGSGRSVDLASFQPNGKPVLVWAWAPYCPYCRREAPAVEEFARLHRADLQVVGVGTQNTADEARAFRRQTGIRSFPLLYETDGFRSWKPFGFVAQPAAALLSPDGHVLRTWSGPFDEAEVLRLIAT